MSAVKKPIVQVRELVDAGAPIGDAIRIVLGGSIPKWAAKHGLHRTPASMTISGRRVPPDASVLAALAHDLDASTDEVRELLALATGLITAVAS
jgi:hypothetical protein